MSVSALISAAQGYASSLVEQATSAMADAAGAASGVGYSIPNLDPVALPNEPEQSISVTVPNLVNVDLVLPVQPESELVFQDIPPVVLGTAPEFSATAPTFTPLTAPAQLAQFLTAAPSVDTTIAFPAPPSELMNPLLAAPVLAAGEAPALRGGAARHALHGAGQRLDHGDHGHDHGHDHAAAPPARCTSSSTSAKRSG